MSLLLLLLPDTAAGGDDKVGTDTGSGAEGTIVLTVTISATADTGSGTEGTIVLTAATTGSDTSSGLEGTIVLTAATTGSDTGTGGETGTPGLPVTPVDTAVVTYDISFHSDFIAARDLQVFDTGSGLDEAVIGFLVRILTDTDTGVGHMLAHRNASGRGLSFLALRTRPDVADEWQVPDLP